MIDDRSRIFSDLRSFDWTPSQQSFGLKLHQLDEAITQSTWDIGSRCFEKSGDVHLAFSGGVDSTLLLYKLVGHGFPVVAHTMVSGEGHPDLIHARKAVEEIGRGVTHKVHIVASTEEDTKQSNRVLGVSQERPDNYLLLMRAICQDTRDLLCGDCIDELMGGYYAHLENPGRETFRDFLERLIPEHLTPLDRCSSLYRVRVHLPYADLRVLDACRKFYFQELIIEGERKKPICELGRLVGVPEEIVARRKRGLVSALEV